MTFNTWGTRMQKPMDTLRLLADRLVHGDISAETLCQTCLDTVAATDNPSAPAFLSVFAAEALDTAQRIDRARQQGEALPPFAGVPFAAKDLFDIEGKTTGAGAVVTDTDPPAREDAVVVSALRRAGLVLIGTTNMTEFAFSGLGLNPHFGTPEAVSWSGEGRAPGGSSSGAGVSLARGMVPLSLGTDTAGSCRIPAAWNNVVGFKPTQANVSRDGVYPLSRTLDVPGPLAMTVDCCRVATALMRGLPAPPRNAHPLNHFRFIVPEFDTKPEFDPSVSARFSAAIDALTEHGADVSTTRIRAFDEAVGSFLSSPIAAFEAWTLHRDRLATHSHRYDQNVARRLRGGEGADEQAHSAKLVWRDGVAVQFRQDTPDNTFYLLPTTANTPPTVSALESDDDLFKTTNLAALTMTSTANFLDGCAISLPIGQGIGLSVIGPGGTDDDLLDAAEAIETALR